ncbi:MAG: hypothetical protein QOJ59_5391 [Thermomicrobiales bacterium]|jgi:hypothetical protein|nr:hypothetical protein [Thermomicrobiales bacterium]
MTDDSDLVKEFSREWNSLEEVYDAVPMWPDWAISWRELGGRSVKAGAVTSYMGREYGLSQDAQGAGEEGFLLPRFSLYALDRLSEEPPSSGWRWRVLFRQEIPGIMEGEDASPALAVLRKRLPALLKHLEQIAEPPLDDADVAGELPWRWTGSIETFYSLVPIWPKWTVYRSYLGTQRVKRSFVTSYGGHEYAIGQDAGADSEGPIRLLPSFYICDLERPQDPPLADWFWHVIHRAAISGIPDGAEATAQLASLRRRLPELLARMQRVLPELGVPG